MTIKLVNSGGRILIMHYTVTDVGISLLLFQTTEAEFNNAWLVSSFDQTSCSTLSSVSRWLGNCSRVEKSFCRHLYESVSFSQKILLFIQKCQSIIHYFNPQRGYTTT